jgi:hypothetical protein
MRVSAALADLSADPGRSWEAGRSDFEPRWTCDPAKDRGGAGRHRPSPSPHELDDPTPYCAPL